MHYDWWSSKHLVKCRKCWMKFFQQQWNAHKEGVFLESKNSKNHDPKGVFTPKIDFQNSSLCSNISIPSNSYKPIHQKVGSMVAHFTNSSNFYTKITNFANRAWVKNHFRRKLSPFFCSQKTPQNMLNPKIETFYKNAFSWEIFL